MTAPRHIRKEVLEALRSEHQRLGRPIRRYQKMRVDPQNMARIVTDMIKRGDDLHYSEPDDDEDDIPNFPNETCLYVFSFIVIIGVN